MGRDLRRSAGNGQLPYYLGFAEIFGERITIAGCLVTPWELLQPCSAECGAGREIWYRRVLGVVEAGADCSTFEEAHAVHVNRGSLCTVHEVSKTM